MTLSGITHSVLLMHSKNKSRLESFPCFGKKRNPLDFNGADARCESRFPLQLFFYRLPLKYLETEKRGFGLFFSFQ